MTNAPQDTDVQARLKNALLALQKMRTRLEAVERARSEPIAIVGMGCRFPGDVNTPEDFWQALQNGVDAIQEVPATRWNIDAYYDADPDVPGKMNTRWGGFIEQPVDLFDAQFFGISPREARSMDPQQRMLLEVSWEALEDAGIAPTGLAGSQTGVFVGITMQDYLYYQSNRIDPNTLDAYHATGGVLNAAVGRISYVLGLRGPCMAVDTACSSSLVSVHLAVQSLRSGEADVALAGGVNFILLPEMTVSLTKAHMMAPDGRCKTFDAQANGFVRAEGCGMIVLKRLSDAQADGDRIIAVIRGSATNHGGFSSGFTVPNKLAQEAVIKQALVNAGVQPSEVSYVETHGTGTSLGDPIEVRALVAALHEGRTADNPLRLGSAKTNFGHLEAGAGIIGLMKLALAIHHAEIPPHLHLHELNPFIAWNEMPLEIPTTRTAWTERRIGGVSSFGASGVNAHALLEAAPTAEPLDAPVRPTQLVTLSARSEAALRDLARRYADYVGAHPALRLADAAYTANTGRAHFSFRLGTVAETPDGLAGQLAAFAEGQDAPGVTAGFASETSQPKVAFLFTGQGAQYAGMGRALYDTEPVFREALDQCDALLRPHLPRPLLSIIFAEDAESAALLDDTTYTQPALFALEYALAQLWLSWGVQPAAAMGHSVGEYVAACIAGVFSLEDGLKLIAARGRLMGGLPAGGTMVAVLADETLIETAIAPYRDQVSIAAVNGPGNLVISGAGTAVEEIAGQLQSKGIKTRSLVVSHAFHSPLMDSILDEFEQIAGEVTYQAPRLALISNVTGRAFTPNEVPDARYWRDHIRAAVQFKAAMETLGEQGYGVFVEVGPNPTLLGMGRNCLPENYGVWLPSLRKGKDDRAQILAGLAGCYANGVPVNFVAFHKGFAGSKTALPTYPFERRKYWIEPKQWRKLGAAAGETVHPLLGARVRAASKDIIFEAQLDPETPAFLADHAVFDSVVLPATAYIEMGLAAGAEVFGYEQPSVEDVVIQEALVLRPEGRTVQTIVNPDGMFQVYSRGGSEDDWHLHAAGRVVNGEGLAVDSVDLAALRAELADEVSAEQHYGRVSERGMRFGASFTGMRSARRREGVALGHIRLPDGVDTSAYHVHPALLDACLQAAGVVLPDGDDSYLPMSLEVLRIEPNIPAEVWSYVALRPVSSAEIITADIQLVDESGALVGEVHGIAFKRLAAGALTGSAGGIDDLLYTVAWERKDRAGEVAQSETRGRWLILADRGGVAHRLAERLTALREEAILVWTGEEYDDSSAQYYAVNPAKSGDFDRLLRDVGTDSRALRGVVHLWGLDGGAGEPDTTQLNTAQIAGSGGALHLTQALLRAGLSPAIWLVTRGVIGAADHAPIQAPLWGLGRIIALEHPELRAVRIDLDPTSIADEAETLVGELLAPDGEDQIALRQDGRYVARMARAARDPQQAILGGQPFRLAIAEKGVLDNLSFAPLERRKPGAGEIEIRVHATGLGFRDVLAALGMYPGEVPALGSECVGTVAAVGAGVEQFQVGDPVIALAVGSFGSHVTIPADFAVRKPDNLTFEEAATIPSPFLTSHYGLDHLAGMKAGDRVLVHAAAGGVGLAAVQLALRAGAEVFGTAGSEEKRAFLRSIGVHHVLNSRTLDFADEITQITGGRGVDIVLNSLAAEFIARSVEILAEGGRFIEIGKRDIWTPEQMAAARPDVGYHIIDPVNLMSGGALVQSILSELRDAFSAGTLKPIPLRVFPMQNVVDAFRYMAQARHIGRIIVTQVVREEAGRTAALPIYPNATYVVTGGLRGIGLEVTRWLAGQGARHLLVVGRSDPSPETEAALNDLQSSGVQVVVARADVSQTDVLADALAAVGREMPPLRGVIHCAAVYDDGVVAGQDWTRFERVFAPKVAGTWNLHLLTRNQPLDFFVMFSAGASLIGSAGQSNYVAANTFLDMFGAYRRAQGLPATAINWGPWSEVGAAAHMDERFAAQGIGAFTTAQGLHALGEVLRNSGDLPSQVGVVRINWPRYLAGNDQVFFSNMVQKGRGVAPAAVPAQNELLKRLEEAPPSKRHGMLVEFVRVQAVKALGLEASFAVDPRIPLQSLGLDSLMAVELRNLLGNGLGFKRSLPATLVFDHPTMDALASYLEKELFTAETAEPTPEAGDGAQEAALDELAQLSDAEAEALLMEELKSIRKKK